MSRGSVTVTPCLSPLAGYERRIINTLTFLLNRQMIASAYVPPHLYGQLVQHQEGAEVIANLPYLSGYFDIVSQKSSGECANVRESKAAIWAVVSVAVADPILFCISRLHQPSASAVCISRLHQPSASAVCISRLHRLSASAVCISHLYQPSASVVCIGCLHQPSASAIFNGHLQRLSTAVLCSCSCLLQQSLASVVCRGCLQLFLYICLWL